ncbi:MAG: NAD(P)/FAD-dependent oxidoreductase [Endomicrobiaceae bacterium]
MNQKYDVAIIGAGPAGYTAAVKFAQLGFKVAVVEKDKLGGTCLNSGCIPTKFLWQAAKTKQKILKSYEYGIKSSMEPLIFSDIINKKNKIIENLSKGIQRLLESYKIDIVKGKASFKSSTQLHVKSEFDGVEFEISADKIIIATGSKTKSVADIQFDHIRYIDSTDALNIESIPKNMLVIGGGAIGIELSSIFSSFGCDVTLRESFPQLLPAEDSELSCEILKNLLRQGVKVEVSCENSLKDEDKFEKVLIVAGRQSSVEELSISNISLETDKRNFILSDKYSTNIDNIFAVGDVSGKSFLAYTAGQDGINVAEKIVNKKDIVSDEPIPKVVFSFPPAASVKDIKFDDYKNILYGKFQFSANARAQIEFERTGWVKVAVDKDSEKILGVWIIGNNADELINTASVMIKANVKVSDLSKNIFFHPGLSETILGACEQALQKCPDLPKSI